ncbi:DUF4177 domain-containing protein [Exiguobacterium antarcticum]|uniref:DUF4177 domain-containing protein n=1 Tax=Exiguobacterium antarcticum TaxID=132920 RepID=A0ABT6R2L4_9BACL|nr:DUF4177 domain-containing protein [Exiguobacterium antarcticum]AFS70410.1 Hypothetical protein Eab7_1279 [Exiguobacterium antarcticum B7]MDI3235176.1 DUF4177 domain-containing protein [Exiguobacterium antarcticum]
MFEYQSIRIDFKRLSGNPKEDYRNVITQQAEDGWRFIQLVALDFVTSGVDVGTYYERPCSSSKNG